MVASARIDHRAVAVAVNRLGRPRLLAETPKLLVSLEPSGLQTNAGSTTVLIRPGSTAQARLKIQRNGFAGVVVFSLENLPHGVIVENLGLNGITFLPEENEREISFAAAPWVGELERPFHAVESQAGRQTSRPLVLQVRRPPAALTAESRNAQE